MHSSLINLHISYGVAWRRLSLNIRDLIFWFECIHEIFLLVFKKVPTADGLKVPLISWRTCSQGRYRACFDFSRWTYWIQCLIIIMTHDSRWLNICVSSGASGVLIHRETALELHLRLWRWLLKTVSRFTPKWLFSRATLCRQLDLASGCWFLIQNLCRSGRIRHLIVSFWRWFVKEIRLFFKNKIY